MFGRARKLVRKVTLFAPAACKHLVDAAINADVGPPEAVNGLLRVSHQKELSRNRASFTPVRCSCIAGGQQQQDLGLQRIRILELVDEDSFETLLEAGAHLRVIVDEIACFEQEVEKVEGAGLGFCGFIGRTQPRSSPRSAAARSALASASKAARASCRFSSACQTSSRRHAAAVIFAAAFARIFKVAIVTQVDEARLEAIVVAGCYRFGATDFVGELPGRPAIRVQRVGGKAGRLQ